MSQAVSVVKKLKILHVTEAMGGGVQNAISKYTHILDSSEHIVLGRPRNGEASGEFSAGTRVLEFHGNLLKYLQHIVKVAKYESPDIVHLHSSMAGLSRALLPPSVAIAYSPHCYAFERRDKSPLYRAVLWLAEWMLAQRKQVLVAVSPHEATLGRQLNPRMPVHYVPNVLIDGVEHSSVTAAKTVSMVGRIGEQKDPLLFAAIANELGHELDFLWIGDGDPVLKQKLTSSGVQVSGWVSPSKARQLVSSSALYLHTGSWEAAPISAMEAAAVGVPVIARGIPTMDSLGYFTAPESAAALTAAVRDFFGDPVSRRRVTEQTELLARGLSQDDAKQKLTAAYDNFNHMKTYKSAAWGSK